MIEFCTTKSDFLKMYNQKHATLLFLFYFVIDVYFICYIFYYVVYLKVVLKIVQIINNIKYFLYI